MPALCCGRLSEHLPLRLWCAARLQLVLLNNISHQPSSAIIQHGLDNSTRPWTASGCRRNAGASMFADVRRPSTIGLNIKTAPRRCSLYHKAGHQGGASALQSAVRTVTARQYRPLRPLPASIYGNQLRCTRASVPTQPAADHPHPHATPRHTPFAAPLPRPIPPPRHATPAPRHRLKVPLLPCPSTAGRLSFAHLRHAR